MGGGFAPWRDAAAPSNGMAFARTVLILSKLASLEHKSDAIRLSRSPASVWKGGQRILIMQVT